MLVVSPLSATKDERQSEMESFCNGGDDDFSDFSCGNLLDSIDFDDLFVGINDEDVLPDLEMDPEILAEFSLSGGEESEITTTTTSTTSNEKMEENCSAKEEVEKGNYSSSGQDAGSNSNSNSCLIQTHEDVVMSKRDESKPKNPSSKEADHKARKSSAQSKNNPQGKRKVKVDWTPELHRRFVQAVEKLGVDKAVPSRILEIMGIDCLTRHNIASHLQKYRSHRKHLLAREAEAANWSQRRQMYGGAATVATAGVKREMSPWTIAPTMGFPPMAPMPHFRPLHVWGHPSVDQSLMPVWPKHLGPSPPPHPPATWASAAPPHAPTQPPPDPSFWHSHHAHVPNSLTPGTPCFPPHLAPTRFPTPPVPGIPPPPLYKVDPAAGNIAAVPTPRQPLPQPPIDFHPSKESIDAAIGDVLSKPWQPLPLGLKPPSVDGVLGELHRQGISRIPPKFDDISCC